MRKASIGVYGVGAPRGRGAKVLRERKAEVVRSREGFGRPEERHFQQGLCEGVHYKLRKTQLRRISKRPGAKAP